jgi:ADP-ribose pyrophosphatase YjhB (NUDIX family)
MAIAPLGSKFFFSVVSCLWIIIIASAGAVVEGQDLSLFYGDETQLTTVTESRKFLPKDLYGRMVRDAVVCCVDILLVRRNEDNGQRQALVVERSCEPVKGVWWLPGGRLLKGETFFDAARRKAREETGITNVTCIQVLGVWNTFFPTSHWDDETSQGTQTVNPTVLVEINNNDNNGGDVDCSSIENMNVKLDETSNNYRWISLDPKENETEDRYVLQALLRLQHWDPNYAKG